MASQPSARISTASVVLRSWAPSQMCSASKLVARARCRIAPARRWPTVPVMTIVGTIATSAMSGDDQVARCRCGHTTTIVTIAVTYSATRSATRRPLPYSDRNHRAAKTSATTGSGSGLAAPIATIANASTTSICTRTRRRRYPSPQESPSATPPASAPTSGRPRSVVTGPRSDSGSEMRASATKSRRVTSRISSPRLRAGRQRVTRREPRGCRTGRGTRSGMPVPARTPTGAVADTGRTCGRSGTVRSSTRSVGISPSCARSWDTPPPSRHAAPVGNRTGTVGHRGSRGRRATQAPSSTVVGTSGHRLECDAPLRLRFTRSTRSGRRRPGQRGRAVIRGPRARTAAGSLPRSRGAGCTSRPARHAPAHRTSAGRSRSRP